MNTYFYQACYQYEGYIEAEDIYEAISAVAKELKLKYEVKEQTGFDISLRIWRVSDMGNLNDNEG